MCRTDLRGLYVITDTRTGDALVAAVRAALQGGARLVQYRDKSADAVRRLGEARSLVALCETFGALLIINDDVQLAHASRAHGVHLGRDDGDVEAARRVLGEAAIIGVSCYDEFARAQRGKAVGADYVAFGSVFPSSTKPDAARAPLKLFSRARELGLPSCAIGGIDAGNIQEVVNAGADMAAVISAVFATEDIRKAAAELSGVFGNR